MAVTSIWPIKGRVEDVIRYAANPEKTTEKRAGEIAALHAVDDVIEYAAEKRLTTLYARFPVSPTKAPHTGPPM